MKRLIFLLFPLSLFAQDGIQFQNLTWEKALEEAGRSKKLIFVHAYAEWSQPCQAISKYTFTEKEVGDFFNNAFINVQFDMEKYPGIELAEKFEVEIYPNQLFVNAKGELVHQGCGALEKDDLLALANEAVTPEKTLQYFKKKYESEELTTDLIDAYFFVMQNACQPIDDMVDDYFENVPEADLTKAINWHVLREYVFDIYSREFLFLLANQEAFMKSVNPDEVQDKIYDTFMLTYMDMTEAENPLFAIKSIRYLAQQHEFEGRDELLHYLDFGEGELIEDWMMYARGAKGFVKPELEDPDLLLDIAWKFYLFIDDKELLLAGLNWTKYLLDNLEPNPATIDTYASLLFKLGQKENAVKFGEQALQLAQSWGEETEHYEFQLKKFKEGR